MTYSWGCPGKSTLYIYKYMYIYIYYFWMDYSDLSVTSLEGCFFFPPMGNQVGEYLRTIQPEIMSLVFRFIGVIPPVDKKYHPDQSTRV